MNRKWQLSKPLMVITLLTLGTVCATHSQGRGVKQDITDNTAKPENVIALKVTGPNGAWARATVIEGGSLRVEDTKTGAAFAFFPTADGANKGNVTVKVFQVNKGSSTENLYEIESLGLSINSMRSAISSSAFIIEVEAVMKHFFKGDRSANKVTLARDARILAQGGGGNCCITCNGMTWCTNCAIFTSCGCCNTDACAGECN